MADSEIIRRLVQQAQGQGGPAFALRLPTVQDRTNNLSDPALDMMAGREGMSTPDYLASLDPRAAEQHRRRIQRNTMTANEPMGDGMNFPSQTDLDLRYQQQQRNDAQSIPRAAAADEQQRMAPILRAQEAERMAGLEPVRTGSGMPTPPAAPPNMVNAGEFGNMFDAQGNPIQPEAGTGYNPFGQLARTVFGDAAIDRATDRPSRAPAIDPITGEPVPESSEAGLTYGMDPAEPVTTTPLSYPPNGSQPRRAPGGQVIPGQPGAVQNAPHQSGIGPIAPSDPEAYDPETGTRSEEARRGSVIERIFGQEGSDRRNSMGKSLMMAGAAIMQSQGSLGQAIGEGVQQGILTYDEAQRAISDEAKEARQMGMEDEAFALDMELKRLAIVREKREGSLAMQRAQAALSNASASTEKDPIADAMIMAARLESEMGMSRDDAIRVGLGTAGITNKASGNPQSEDPMAGLFQ